MSLGKSKLETEIHKRRADEKLLTVYSRRKKKPKTIDSRSLFSARVPYNDDWEKKLKADMIAFGSLFSPLLPNKDGLGWEMKPKCANPFLCEGGFESLSLISTQVPQNAAVEEIGFFKKEMTKPVCEDLSCGICGGAHHHSACDLRKHCPTDQKVGEGFVVICYCGNDLINGKCRLGCPPYGKAIGDKSFHNPPPLFSGLISSKNGFCREVRPENANPFLCEGGFGSLSLLSTQETQKAAGEEIGFKFKKEMTNPLCEDLSCGICGGAHHHSACDLRKHCPTDQKVGEGFVVICYCGNDLINGKCRLGCPTFGKAISDPPSFVSELFSNGCEKMKFFGADDWEMKPKNANPFLCEGGFESLSLTTQVPQKGTVARFPLVET